MLGPWIWGALVKATGEEVSPDYVYEVVKSAVLHIQEQCFTESQRERVRKPWISERMLAVAAPTQVLCGELIAA